VCICVMTEEKEDERKGRMCECMCKCVCVCVRESVYMRAGSVSTPNFHGNKREFVRFVSCYDSSTFNVSHVTHMNET